MKALFTAMALMTLGPVALAAEPATSPDKVPFALDDDQMDQVKAGAGKPGSHSGSEMRTGQISDGADPYPTINAGRRGMGGGGAS
jgi:hypothetical protein